MDYFFRLHKSRCCFNKRSKAKRNYLPKGVIDNYNVTVNGKKFYDQPIDSDIKRYEEIGKLTAGQGKVFIKLWLYKKPLSINSSWFK